MSFKQKSAILDFKKILQSVIQKIYWDSSKTG